MHPPIPLTGRSLCLQNVATYRALQLRDFALTGMRRKCGAAASIAFFVTTVFVNSQNPPFTQAPPIGQDTSAAILLVIDPDGTLRVKTDPSQGPFDGIEDTLFGVQNNSAKTILAIPIKSSMAIFGFDGDGFDTVDPHPAGAPFGPTGYEGPGVSFTGINADQTSGIVNFAGGIPPGGSAYFGLELAISTLCPPISGVPLIKQLGITDTLDSLPATYCSGSKCKPGTIAFWGCAITSCAMLINYVAGADVTTPEAINGYLISRPKHDGYFGASVNWLAVADYAATLNVPLSYRGTITHRDDFALDSYLCSGTPVILSVLNNAHFVIATGQTTVNGNDTYLINDPAAYPNDTTLQPFNYTYAGLRPFSTASHPRSALYIVAHSPVELMLTQPSGEQTGANRAAHLENITDSSYGAEALVEDIDGSGLTLPEVKILEILQPIDGHYSLRVQGTATGPFSLDFWGYDDNGEPTTQSISGQATPGSSADYTVAYSSAPGSQISVSPVPTHLANISTRVAVGAGDNVAIAGFVLGGTAPKKVIVRAVGPSININGVPLPGTLQDPIVELHDKDNLLQSNDDWRSNQEQEIENSLLPPTDDRESAIVTTLQPGVSYTAILRGKNDTTGIAVVEVFDLAPVDTAEVVEISTRGQVQTDDNVMIAGFILAASAPEQMLIRAIGPSLGQLGVANVLADPTLSLFDANGVQFAVNDDWRDTQQTAIEATNLAPSDNAESAILVPLVSGAYTAIVRGKNATTGVALVEVYKL
jgi:Peptidase_C39 like family